MEATLNTSKREKMLKVDQKWLAGSMEFVGFKVEKVWDLLMKLLVQLDTSVIFSSVP